MIKTKRGLRREALEFERVLTVNMLRARLKGLVLAWPDLGALPQGPGVGVGVGGVHWQCQDAETDEDLEESSMSEREVVGGLQSCSSCSRKQMEETGGKGGAGTWEYDAGRAGSSLFVSSL